MTTETTPTPEEAFQASELYEFAGQKLEPFSFLRQSALVPLSNEMGRTYSTEVVIALWLMMQPDLTVKKARRTPAAYTDDIDAFAEAHGLSLFSGDRFAGARALYEQVLQDLEATKGTPDVETATDEGTDPN